MRLFSDLYLGGFARQHPDRNLQTLLGCVNDADRSIAPLGPAKDLQDSTVKGVKGVEDLNISISRAQGIVGVGVIIRTCTAWFQPVACLRITRDGFGAANDSSCLLKCSGASSAGSFWRCSPPLFAAKSSGY